MSGFLDSPVLTLLQNGLDASSLRQRVLANNIANVDTPGFKRSDVDFSRIFASALGQGNDLSLKETSSQDLPGVLASSQTGVIQDQSTSLRNDGNNVDIDQEMADVANNGLYYDSLTQAISSQLGLLRMAIQGKSS